MGCGDVGMWRCGDEGLMGFFFFFFHGGGRREGRKGGGEGGLKGKWKMGKWNIIYFLPPFCCC